MYVKSPERAIAFAKALRKKTRAFAGVSVVLAPAFPLIPPVVAALKGSAIHIGAQTLSPYVDEQHTGEVSGAMLKHAGASFVIIGHSERRAMGEHEDIIRVELKIAAEEGLMPILCVGEKERDAHGGHFTTLARQLTAALGEKSAKHSIKRLVVAYEPVWAIGKSAAEAMKPAELQETTIFIRKILADLLGRHIALRTAILYGGSVEAENAHALIEGGSIAGFLVGHASAELDTLLPILRACARP
jgi:triosephosphate isomerase